MMIGIVRIGRQREVLRLLHIDPDLVAGPDAAGEEGRGDAEARALVDLVAHRIDGERDAAGIASWATTRSNRRRGCSGSSDSMKASGSGRMPGNFCNRGQHVEASRHRRPGPRRRRAPWPFAAGRRR